MAYRELIRREAQKALSFGGYLKDLPSRVDYYAASDVEPFDPSTQGPPAEDAPESVDVVFVEYKADEIDGVNILAEDKQALVSDLNLQKSGIGRPVKDDRLVEADGSSWKVMDVTTDTALAVWVLHCRKP